MNEPGRTQEILSSLYDSLYEMLGEVQRHLELTDRYVKEMGLELAPGADRYTQEEAAQCKGTDAVELNEASTRRRILMGKMDAEALRREAEALEIDAGAMRRAAIVQELEASVRVLGKSMRGTEEPTDNGQGEVEG
jgi:hypothetical protein